MTINKDLPNLPKRGHPDQFGVDLPQSTYLDPQMISRMANQIFHEVPLPPGLPEISGQSNLLTPAAFAGSFDVYKVRKDFPALQQQVNGKTTGLVGQRCHHAKAPMRYRRAEALVRAR